MIVVHIDLPAAAGLLLLLHSRRGLREVEILETDDTAAPRPTALSDKNN